MKILFLSRYQETINRGAEANVKQLTSALSRNHHVDIFSGKQSDSLRAVLRGKYDVVIPVNGRMQAFKVSVGRLFGSYKLLITGRAGIGKDELWNIIVKPDVFVATTDHVLKWAKKWAWGSKLTKIPNGVDLEKFSPFGEKFPINLPKPVILSVGALEWYKFHERAINAVAKLKKGSLLVVGKGPQLEKLQYLGSGKLNGRFQIISAKYNDMPKIYRSADLFTLPSWDREAFGVVYLEAMASGLGIVAPDDASRHEIIGEAGIFVDVGDTNKYAGAIKQALAIDWSKKAVKQAKKFSWEKIANQYGKLLGDITKK